ncbi:hypothetical protein D3C79_920840 [compost metagenome]
MGCSLESLISLASIGILTAYPPFEIPFDTLTLNSLVLPEIALCVSSEMGSSNVRLSTPSFLHWLNVKAVDNSTARIHTFLNFSLNLFINNFVFL